MKRVVEEMAKAKGDVEKRLRYYIPEIIKECMAFAYLGKAFTFNESDLSERVNKRLISLSDDILSDIEERARKSIQYADEEEDEDAILAYIKRPIDGQDIVERIDKHCSTLRYFLEGWLAIGFVNNLKEYELTNQILTYIDNPIASSLWQEARNAGYFSDSIRAGVYLYGKGNQKNVLSALTEIERYAINEAFQYGSILHYGKEGAIGYMIHRGSTYDCPYCDSNCGFVIPLDDIRLPQHPRCVCYSTPVYANEASEPLDLFVNAKNGISRRSKGSSDWIVNSYGRGIISVHREVSKTDSDYNDLMSIAKKFASEGRIVTIPPKLSRSSSFNYEEIYSSLKNTPFWGKCPDLNIDGNWFEHEGYLKGGNPDRALSNMLKRGLKQSDRLIIMRTNHTTRHLKHRIRQRINEGQNIQEIWTIDENELLELIYKNSGTR